MRARVVFLSDAEAQSISSVSLVATSCWLQSLHVFFLKGKDQDCAAYANAMCCCRSSYGLVICDLRMTKCKTDRFLVKPTSQISSLKP